MTVIYKGHPQGQKQFSDTKERKVNIWEGKIYESEKFEGIFMPLQNTQFLLLIIKSNITRSELVFPIFLCLFAKQENMNEFS